jgi:hypothetical protein
MKVSSFYSPFGCACCSFVDGFALWCLMNFHMHTPIVTVVNLIVLSNIVLSSLSFVDHIVECIIVIFFFVPTHVASLL